MSTGESALTVYIAHRVELVNYANGIMGDRGRAEDVVQEAYLKFADAAARRLFDEPVSYLYRIVHNLAFDGLRRLSLEGRYVKPDAQQDLESVPEDKPTLENALVAREELKRVLAAVSELSQRHRIAFEMHRVSGYKLREIAAHLGISVPLVHSLVAEALKHCMRRL